VTAECEITGTEGAPLETGTSGATSIFDASVSAAPTGSGGLGTGSTGATVDCTRGASLFEEPIYERQLHEKYKLALGQLFWHTY
jgi:hypothetical protein